MWRFLRLRARFVSENSGLGLTIAPEVLTRRLLRLRTRLREPQRTRVTFNVMFLQGYPNPVNTVLQLPPFHTLKAQTKTDPPHDESV